MTLSSIQRVALYFFLFSINFEVWDPLNSNGNFSIAKLTGFLYFVSIIPQLPYFLNFKGFIRFLAPIWLFFGLLTIINIVNLNYFSSNFFNFSLFQNIILLIILINHAKREPTILVKGLISFALGSVVFSFLFYLGIGIQNDGGRISIFGDNENAIGIRICISIIYILVLIVENPLRLSLKRLLLLIPIPILFSLMVATASRVSFISFFLSFLVGLIALKAGKKRIKILIFTLGLLIGYYFYNYILISDLLYQRLLNSAENRSLAGRDVIWKSLIPIIKNNPFFGVGTTGYGFFTNQVFGEVTSPHNVILEVLCYTGIIGLSIYLVFLFRIMKAGIDNYRSKGTLLQLILLIPVLGLILSGQLLTAKICWVLFAFAIERTSSYKFLIHKNKLIENPLRYR